jgi:hypothetical protein
MNKGKKDLRTVYLLFGVLAMVDLTFIIILLCATYGVTRPIELSGNIECNSGNLGIDYKSDYNSKVNFNNYTKQYEGDFIPKILNLKGIDNLNCKLSFNIKGTSSQLLEIIGGGYNG